MGIMDDWGELKNSEGYCPKCRAPLGIEGTCYACAVNEDDFQALIKSVYTCPICGMHKTHHRLYGYRCNNPEHAEMEHEIRMRTLDNKRKD